MIFNQLPKLSHGFSNSGRRQWLTNLLLVVSTVDKPSKFMNGCSCNSYHLKNTRDGLKSSLEEMERKMCCALHLNCSGWVSAGWGWYDAFRIWDAAIFENGVVRGTVQNNVGLSVSYSKCSTIIITQLKQITVTKMVNMVHQHAFIIN